MKKVIFLLVLIFSFSVNIFAQSMTDEKVVEYVQQCQSQGMDQATIVSKLLQKGVTIQQIQKIRKKYEAQKDNLGAKDLINTTTKSQNRIRTDKQIGGESYQMKNNYLKRIDSRGYNGMQNYTNDEKNQILNDEIGFLDIDSLLYYQNKFKDESQVFGKNIFNNSNLTFQPNINIATPSNYVLGAGDNVIIDVWGASQETFEGEISPDGYIVIQGVGPIHLAGVNIAQATSTLKNKLGRFYSDSEISISLGNVRSIQVQVMGEVVAPGTYQLSSLSSAFNALYLAGGISDIGTLRDIKVYRNGRQISSIDVYDYIINGNIKGDVRLQDNDIIVVGPYEELVKISGRVKRPMYYEMRKGESVKTILDYSGGYAGDAYRKNIRLVRKNNNGSEYSIHTIEEFDMCNFQLADGDSLYVDSVIARYSNMAEIKGAVFHPGMYEVGGNVSTVKDLLTIADGLLEEAFGTRAVMHRTREDQSLEVISVDAKGILDGTRPDIPLKKNDVLFVPSQRDFLDEQTLTIKGEVVYPGVYQYAANTTLEDLVLQAGGLTNQASTSKVDVFRRIYDSKSMTTTDKISETYSFSLKDGFVIDGQSGFTLMPFDEIVVRKSPVSSTLQSVTISGSVNFAGSYTMTSKKYKLSDLIQSAGGLSHLAYAKGARLERKMTEEERQQQETSLKSQQIALYENSLTADKNFDIRRADSILAMKMDIGTTYPVAISLDEALKDTSSAENITLREGDHVFIPQYSNTVKISGAVMYPISMNYKKGAPLNYYIKRAGGYGNRARKNRVYAIYMNGSVELVNKRSSKSIQPGCEIVIPSKDIKDKMSTAEVMSIGTTAASISTMMVSIANILK